VGAHDAAALCDALLQCEADLLPLFDGLPPGACATARVRCDDCVLWAWSGQLTAWLVCCVESGACFLHPERIFSCCVCSVRRVAADELLALCTGAQLSALNVPYIKSM
jgi:hypothetical protein